MNALDFNEHGERILRGDHGSYPLDQLAALGPGHRAARYAKRTTIMAAALPFDCIIETLEGPMHAREGDYLAQAEDGHAWPIKKSVFAQTYELADGS